MRYSVLIASVCVFLQSLAGAGEAPEPSGDAAARLKKLDKDGDGMISAKELGRPKLMKHLDLDKDGQISEDELISGAARMRLAREARNVEVDKSPDKGEVQSDPKRIEKMYFPPLKGNDWEKVRPASLRWKVKELVEAVSYVGTKNSTAFLILYKGRIVVEKYWQGWDLHSRDSIASAAKSITSTLVGIAQEEGKLNINDPVTQHLKLGWSAAPPEKEKQIAVRHLLSMSTGLTPKLDYRAEPDKTWEYNNRTYHLTLDLLEKATGKGRNAYSDEVLWSKIGMRETRWGPSSTITTARDMARYGLLILNMGAWDGRPIVISEFIAGATNSSQDANKSYGFLWWLNGKKTNRLPGPDPKLNKGMLLPSAPKDLIAALGKYDRKIYVVPSRNLIVVRHGKSAGVPRMAASSFDNEIWKRLMRALPPAK